MHNRWVIRLGVAYRLASLCVISTPLLSSISNAQTCSGDTCADPIVISESQPLEVVEIPFDTTCATTDGPTTYPNGCDTGQVTFENDIWMEYTSSVTGRVVVDLCGNVDYDAVVAVYTNGTSRCPNVDEVTGQRTMCPPPLENLVTDQCLHMLCHGPGEPTDLLCALKNQCFLIRIGGTNDAGSGVLSLQSRYSDCFSFLDGQPVIEEIENAQGALVASVKNRVISFAITKPGDMRAVQVTFVDMPGAYGVFDGRSLWVGPPVEYDESPGIGYGRPCDPSCQPGDNTCSACEGDTFWSSELQCDPYYADLSVYDTVHFRDANIVPGVLAPGGGSIAQPAVYYLRSIEQACCLYSVDFFEPAVVQSAGWGDIAELYDGQYVAPDDTVALADLLGMIQKFIGQADDGNLLSKVRVDLVGVGPSGASPVLDGVISISDVVEVLAAFSGGGYAFDPEPWPCP